MVTKIRAAKQQNSDIHTISNVQQRLTTPIYLDTVIYKYAFRFNWLKLLWLRKANFTANLQEHWHMMQQCCFCADCSGMPWYSAYLRWLGINNRQEQEPGIIGLWEGEHTSKNRFITWKIDINLCILHKENLANRSLIYWEITVHLKPCLEINK